MEYQRAIRNKQIERAKVLLRNNDPEMLKKGPHDVTRFIKRVKSKDATDTYIIDQNVIDKEEKYDGFYAIATNLDDDVKAILAISSKRHRIEDCFRVMKTNFSARPVYHQNRERIIAHFMICYTALLIYRLLEAKLDANGTHFTTENIIETLKNMDVMNVQDMYYLSMYSDSKVCTALNDVFHLGLDKKYYQPKYLNKKAKKS
jgi:transposase